MISGEHITEEKLVKRLEGRYGKEQFSVREVDSKTWEVSLTKYPKIRDYFRERKEELDKKIDTLLSEIAQLTPKDPEQFTEDFGAVLKRLKKKLEGYVRCDEPKIPESVVEAFVEKIWVSKDEFRWYLRSGSKVNREDSERIKIAEFSITLDQAKAYQYSFSTRKRIYNWVDLNVSIWI